MYKKRTEIVDAESDRLDLLNILGDEVKVFDKLKVLKRERDFLIRWDIENGNKAGLLKLWKEAK